MNTQAIAALNAALARGKFDYAQGLIDGLLMVGWITPHAHATWAEQVESAKLIFEAELEDCYQTEQMHAMEFLT